MKAFVADRYGGPEVMRLGDLPEPVAVKGGVVVAVRATSINPVDWKIRAGDLRLLSGVEFPRVLGTEFAGVVHAVGAGVTGWAVGDEVYGLTVTALGHPGAHAERTVVPAGALRRKPASLSFEQAVVLPVAGLTALSGIRLCGDLAGREVLVIGATGGVGHFFLQMARACGARVTAVCSARNAAHATVLGAADVLDYRARDFSREPSRFDVVYDAYGQPGFGVGQRVLKPRGLWVTPLGTPGVYARSLVQGLLGGRRLRVGNVRSRPEDYARIEAMLASGAVRPLIDRVLPLDQAAEAFAICEAGGVPGKVVLRVS